MAIFTLNIDPLADAGYIAKELKEQVAIAKKVDGGDGVPGGGNPADIAWQIFSPLPTNQVTWELKYSVYATQTQLKDGATITQTAPLLPPPADTGVVYAFDGTTMARTTDTGAKGTYTIRNDTEKAWNLGLSQASSLSAGAFKPLAVSPTGPQQRTQFTPHETVYVFLTKHKEDGTVTVDTWGPYAEVSLELDKPQTLHFDKKNSKFFVDNPKK
ncbi:hypothetical protein [Streptomyces sp. CBMA156]|uniref:hypothetical protein n=1 Tax=Streptomyces sp. CBMA156 TaxID=1930280 RepID=UPI001661C9F7|nr:hypothetical protein [Streptomyces sp. CBMA156]MBD0674989.1 hypothetical protein [Streptomyces sp. CBMA156]